MRAVVLLAAAALSASAPVQAAEGWSLGGRLDADVAVADEDLDDRRDAADLRRARALLRWRGEDTRGVLLVDGADGEATVLDAWLQVRTRDVAGLRTALQVGRLREPSGLDNLTGSDRLPFQERALPTALAPGYNTGIAASAWDRRRTFAVGAFDGAIDDALLGNDSDRALTARGVWRGWRARPGRDELLHVGVSGSLRAPRGDALRYRVRPESQLYRDAALRTRSVRDVDRYASAGLEAAWRRGPFSAQAEVLWTQVPTDGGNRQLQGAYVQAGWVLSGESRSYSTSTATFGRIQPRGRGGAWELGLRASRLDLDDSGDDDALRGGRGRSVGVALNWTADRRLRVMGQWLRNDFRDAGYSERDHVLQMRMQLAF